MKKNLLGIIFAALKIAAFAQPTTTTFNYTGAAQSFTIPPCVTTVTIEVRGAQGGAVTGQSPFPQGGLGSTMIGDFTVTPGNILTLVVGGRGNPDPSSSGGGGGTGVNLAGTPMIVAGGGAGVDFQQPTYTGQNAVTTNDGVVGGGAGGSPGVAGANGGDIIYSGVNISRGGNGWSVGPNGSTGVNGVSPNTTFTNGTWGLGGGGGSVGYGYCNCGGGGGGYSGGGSGQINNSGGGGGSYNAGTNQINTAGNNTGDGIIIITYTPSAGVPASPTSISGSNSICVGSGPLVYSIASVASATSYTWSVPAGSNITLGQGTTSMTMQPGSTSGNISVTANNACGSSAPTTYSLTINPLPTVTATAASSAICTGNSDVLTASGATSYAWSSGGTASTETVSPTSVTTYTVTGTDANGCVNTGTVTVTVNALPTVSATASATFVCLNDAPISLTGTPAGGTWSGPGVTGATFTPMTAGLGTHTATYDYTDINSCSNSASVVITVDICTTVSEQTLINGIDIYPNPNNGIFTIEVKANVADLKIVISDLQGRMVYSSSENNVAKGYIHLINLQSESSGMYLMEISGNDQKRVEKISVQK